MKHLTRKQRKLLVRILVSAAIFLPLFLLEESGALAALPSPLIGLALFLIPYVLIGYDVLWKAIRNLLHGRIFDECFLMLVATVGALILGFLPGAEAENAEAVGVMLFYQVGELFQSVAVGKSRRSISALMQIRPDVATLLSDGEEREVDPEEVPIGAYILVRPGERIPLDGCITEGSSAIDTSALTGESVPREVAPGDSVISGCVNLTGVLTVRTEKCFGESTVSRILSLVENSTDAKAKSERFITRFARYYTPAVVFAALLLALIPPLFTGFDFVPWIARALTFLVVSCPCALVISVPLSFFGGIGGASKQGILVKGANYFEALASLETVVFDKTGTLTRGRFSVVELLPQEGTDAETLLYLSAHAECRSPHPIALSLREAYGKEPELARVTEVTEHPGFGVTATVDGARVAVGNERLMQELLPAPFSPTVSAFGTVAHIARDGVYLGAVVIADEVKEDSRETVAALKRLGIRETVMLTGDRPETAERIASTLGIDTVHASLLPDEKVRLTETMLQNKTAGKTLVFVGDGINDAPALARADVGIAMGALGSDAAIEAADIVLMDDSPSAIVTAIRIARKTLQIVRQNIFFAIFIKVLVMVLAAFGLASMWLAVFADVGVAVIAILNAMRTLR